VFFGKGMKIETRRLCLTVQGKEVHALLFIWSSEQVSRTDLVSAVERQLQAVGPVYTMKGRPIWFLYVGAQNPDEARACAWSFLRRHCCCPGWLKHFFLIHTMSVGIDIFNIQRFDSASKWI